MAGGQLGPRQGGGGGAEGVCFPQRRMRPPPCQASTHFWMPHAVPRCPWPKGSHFGEPEPQVGAGGAQGLHRVPGAQRGTGVHPNLFPWKRQRLGGGGKRRLQQPRDADKGEGEGSPAAAGAAVGCSRHPHPGPAAETPSAAPKEAVGTACPTLASPSLRSPPKSAVAVPTGSLGTDRGETPAKTLADTLAKTGCAGVEAAGPDQTPHCCTSSPHGPATPARDFPDFHQHHSAH